MFKIKSIIFVDFLRYFSVTKMLTEIQNILKKIQKKIQRLGKVCLKDVLTKKTKLKSKNMFALIFNLLV